MKYKIHYINGGSENKMYTDTIVTQQKYIPYLNKNICVPISKETLRSGIIRAHKDGNMWEPNIADILTTYANPDSICIDIGALIGTHSFVFSNAVGPKGKVYSFEPQPWAYKSILKTININNIKNIEVYNMGLSDKKKELIFCSDVTGTSHIIEGNTCNTPYTYKIDVTQLDNFNLQNISCIKIDVEGHELSVLNGAINTIKNNKPVIIIEVWNKDNKRDEVRMFMKNNNYTMENISGDDFICRSIDS